MSTPGWVSGLLALADADDPPVLEPDIGLDDAPVIDDQRVGDHRVHSPLGARRLGLAHAVADHLAAAELDLLAIAGAIILDLEDEVGIGEAEPVADRGPVHVGIGLPADPIRHQSSPPMTFWLKPQTSRLPR